MSNGPARTLRMVAALRALALGVGNAAGVIDEIIPEPRGGAHRGPEAALHAVGESIAAMLKDLMCKDGKTLVKQRRQKFLDMGSKGLAA